MAYAMVGVLIGPITGRPCGLYLILLLAFIDVGLGQSVMFPSGPPRWDAFLAWLAVITFAAAVVFHRQVAVAGRSRSPVPVD